MVVVVVVVEVGVGHHLPLSIFGTPVLRLPDRHKAATAAINASFICFSCSGVATGTEGVGTTLVAVVVGGRAVVVVVVVVGRVVGVAVDMMVRWQATGL